MYMFLFLSLNPYKGSWGRHFDAITMCSSPGRSIKLLKSVFSVCLFSSLPELFLGEWSWIALLFLWHGHTIAIFFSLLLSKGFRSCWHDLGNLCISQTNMSHVTLDLGNPCISQTNMSHVTLDLGNLCIWQTNVSHVTLIGSRQCMYLTNECVTCDLNWI